MTTVISISMFGTATINTSGTYAIEGSNNTVNIEGPGLSGNPIVTEIVGYNGGADVADISNNASLYLNITSGNVVSDSFNVGEDSNGNTPGHGTLELSSEFSSFNFLPPSVNIFGEDNKIILDQGVSSFTLGDPSFPSGSSFVTTDTIDMKGLLAATASFTQNSFFGSPSAGGTLVLENSAGQQVGEIVFADGTYASNAFSVTMVNGGTDITLCFAAGTKILTDEGPKAIELLKVNDTVVTHKGRIATIKWIGRRRLDTSRHPRPEVVLPVLIEANALLDGVPACDLYLSPDHALYMDGYLIPAKALINGYTIRQVERKIIEYFHIELENHDVIYAEGTPVETYLDTGNRNFFESGKHVSLHPDFGQRLRETIGCAPFVECGEIVEAVRARILDRAGIVTVDDPAIVVISQPDGSVVIRSRCATPGYISRDPRDRRVLGIKIAEITSSNGSIIPLDHPSLTDGWYDMEADGRWTNGNAAVPATIAKGGLIHVKIAATLAYPVGQPAIYHALKTA